MNIFASMYIIVDGYFVANFAGKTEFATKGPAAGKPAVFPDRAGIFRPGCSADDTRIHLHAADHVSPGRGREAP